MTSVIRPLADRLRAIPTPAALAVIAGASFFGVPFVAGLFVAGHDTTAQANPAPSDPLRRPGSAGNAAGSLTRGLPTYMPATLGPAVSPATVASAAPFAGGATGGGDGGSGGGQSRARFATAASAAPMAAPAARHDGHGSDRMIRPPNERRRQVATDGLARPVRLVMPAPVAPAYVRPVAPVPDSPVFRPVAPMHFGGGMGGGRHR